jgi:sortase A
MIAKLGKVFIRLGCALVIAALVLGGYTLYNGMRAGQHSDALAAALIDELEAKGTPLPDYMLDPDMEMPVIMIDGDACIGILEIPKLQKKLPILSEWEYDMLKVAPCRYAGSAYRGDMIIAAHNYEAHFARIGELDPGDQVIFTDGVGNVFTYRVVEEEILEPTAVKEMHSGDWDLTLFTCDASITHRIVVRCEKMM